MDWELGVNRGRLLLLEWINNEILLCNTGNNVQSLIMDHDNVRKRMDKIIVIVGPTASGKTALAIDIAKRHNGEIICADSRTVYKGLDIGTAKPTPADQARVPHHGLDLVEPDESFSAADFKSYANQKIAEIRQRGRLPVLVGGTGLYVDSVVYDYQFGPPVDKKRRQELSTMTIEELHEYCHKHNVPLPENIYNKR